MRCLGAPSKTGLGVGGATVVLASGHVAVAAEDGALGDHDLRCPDVADEATGRLDLDARLSLAVALQLAAHHHGRGGHGRLDLSALADAQLPADADVALDGALDDHVLVAQDLSLDRRVRPEDA